MPPEPHEPPPHSGLRSRGSGEPCEDSPASRPRPHDAACPPVAGFARAGLALAATGGTGCDGTGSQAAERAATTAPAPLGPADDSAAHIRLSAARRAGVLAFAAIAGLAFARWVTLPGIPLCGFRVLTGRPCPGCGMTRSLRHLARGEVAESLRMHPLGVVLAAAAVAVLFSALLALRTGRDPVWRWAARHVTIVAAAALSLLVGLWIVRGFVVPEWSPDPIGSGPSVSR